ncbi:MAG: DinB family protein [Chloroflexia bacterium]|nr:DinB family protein [Chloroflexia bacterium]
MDLETIAAQMADSAGAIRALVENVSERQARWKPAADSWSMLEVVNHLRDEEREDFRARVDLILHRGQEDWFGIDPRSWVTERGYNQRELGPSLAGFLEAREESLRWLRGLEAPAWETVYRAPFGPIAAGDILVAWAAHDVLHLRQLVELRWAYLLEQARPYDVQYAGEW